MVRQRSKGVGETRKQLPPAIASTHLGLHGYMLKHGTWPVPPILLNTSESAIPDGFPHELRRPYHLIEGYHRFAMAADLASRDGDAKHEFWVATIVPA